MKKVRLPFLKAIRLKKLGYFKLPKNGHRWAGTKYTWARISMNGQLMPYSTEYLSKQSIEELQEAFLHFESGYVQNNKEAEELTEDALVSYLPKRD